MKVKVAFLSHELTVAHNRNANGPIVRPMVINSPGHQPSGVLDLMELGDGKRDMFCIGCVVV